MSKPPEKQVTWKRQRTPNPSRDMARLTPEECAGVRRALDALHVRCEHNWSIVAKSLGVGDTAVCRARADDDHMSPALAFRLSRALKVSVSEILEGRFPAEGQCPLCGGRGADRPT